jgi:hypothetical protein
MIPARQDNCCPRLARAKTLDPTQKIAKTKRAGNMA